MAKSLMSIFLAYSLILPARKANMSLSLLLTVIHEKAHVLFKLFTTNKNLFRELSLLKVLFFKLCSLRCYISVFIFKISPARSSIYSFVWLLKDYAFLVFALSLILLHGLQAFLGGLFLVGSDQRQFASIPINEGLVVI